MLIPRDLKKGDRLWYSKTKYVVVGHESYKDCYGCVGQVYCTKPGRYSVPPLMIYYSTGREMLGDTDPICRVQRMDGKYPEDKDVEWLLKHAEAMTRTNRETEAPRLRRIARRLKRYAEEHG